MLRFPNALPFIFGGLNVAIVFSITGALVGEFVGAREGLGMLLLQFNFNMDIGGMFAVLIVLGVMGATLHGVVRMLHRRLIFWAQPDDLERRAP
jgi:NitT/TauT family transport system permease protein